MTDFIMLHKNIRPQAKKTLYLSEEFKQLTDLKRTQEKFVNNILYIEMRANQRSFARSLFFSPFLLFYSLIPLLSFPNTINPNNVIFLNRILIKYVHILIIDMHIY